MSSVSEDNIVPKHPAEFIKIIAECIDKENYAEARVIALYAFLIYPTESQILAQLELLEKFTLNSMFNRTLPNCDPSLLKKAIEQYDIINRSLSPSVFPFILWQSCLHYRLGEFHKARELLIKNVSLWENSKIVYDLLGIGKSIHS